MNREEAKVTLGVEEHMLGKFLKRELLMSLDLTAESNLRYSLSLNVFQPACVSTQGPSASEVPVLVLHIG